VKVLTNQLERCQVVASPSRSEFHHPASGEAFMSDHSAGMLVFFCLIPLSFLKELYSLIVIISREFDEPIWVNSLAMPFTVYEFKISL
jgi:hypothetical protein